MTEKYQALNTSIAAGLNYILSRQAEEGAWTEWTLPPGSSSTWTTAYVGYMLRNLPLKPAAIAARRIEKAVHWLTGHALSDCAWGYNEWVGSDADSTAYAILFLTSADQSVPDTAYAALADWQCADGGMTTYLPMVEPHAWNISHPDVTPIVLQAMLTHSTPDQAALQRGIEFVLGQRSLGGLWNSFWWDSCLYATAANLSLMQTMGFKMTSCIALTQIKPANAFESALLISSLLSVQCDDFPVLINDLVDQLIKQQQPDGSWNTAPILRITRRDCYAPWIATDAGPLYAETHRLFTTATVLHALSQVHNAFRI